MAEWVRELDWRPGGPCHGSNPAAATSLRNFAFGNSVELHHSRMIPFTPLRRLPVCFGGDTKSCWSLLSVVYARGSKISHTVRLTGDKNV